MRRQHPIPRSLLQSLIVLILALGACSAASQSWQRIQASGVLRVGLDPTYPPFATADEGELSGVDVDLARAIGSELNLNVEFVYFGYDGLYDALATEQVDVLISALVIRSDQTRDFAYTEPYFNAGQLLVVPARDSNVASMNDLSERMVAVELGAQGHVIATDWQRRLGALTVVPYETPREALDAVVRGEAHAALTDAISARLYLAESDTLHVHYPPISVEPFAMVVRIEDKRLLTELNKALETLEENGQLETIISRHMAPLPQS